MKINAFIIGGQKCGSTALFNYLKSHPDILGHEAPELSFFHHEEYDLGEKYLWKKYYNKLTAQSKKLILAKHVMEFSKQHGLKRIRNHNQAIKIIVCLRNPIERAISAYTYARNQGWENKVIESAFEIEDRRLRQSWKKNKSLGYVYNGLYGSHLINLYKIFSKDQVLVLNYDNFKVNPSEEISRILKFLGIQNLDLDVRKKYNVTTQARNLYFARFIRRILSTNNGIKRLAKKLIPKSKWLDLRNTLLSLNKSRRVSVKLKLSPMLEQLMKRTFSKDFNDLPQEYKDWFKL